jgi:hypothetical protein
MPIILKGRGEIRVENIKKGAGDVKKKVAESRVRPCKEREKASLGGHP